MFHWRWSNNPILKFLGLLYFMIPLKMKMAEVMLILMITTGS